MKNFTPLFLILQGLRAVFGKNAEVGGKPCAMESYPFVVSVTTDVLCGGTLITFSWILIAAHCIKPKHVREDLQYARSSPKLTPNSTQVRHIISAIPHPKFDYSAFMRSDDPDFRYDIGLVKVDIPFDRSDYINVAKLPSVGFTETCTVGKLLGVGRRQVEYQEIHNYTLECVDVTIVARSVCAFSWPKATMDESVLCTVDKDKEEERCRDDLGGPLVCKGIVVGLVSSGKGCGFAGTWATYTNVEKHLDFIRRTINHGSRKYVFEIWRLGIILLSVIII